MRVPKADAVYMSRSDIAKQERAKNPRTPKKLKGGEYVLDQIGRGKATVAPACFGGLILDLAKVWGD